MSDRDPSSSPLSFVRRRGGAPRSAALASALFALPALFALSACGAADAGGDSDERTVVGNMGAIEFAATPLAPPAAGSNAFDVALVARASRARVEGAALRVRVVMPSMGHEATVEPEIEEISPGVYEVTDIVFAMPGTWEVRYRAEGSAIYDEAAFRYAVR